MAANIRAEALQCLAEDMKNAVQAGNLDGALCHRPMKNYGETGSLPVQTDRAGQQFMHFTGRAAAGQNGAFARGQAFAQIQANGKAGLAGGGVFNARADMYRQFFKDNLLMGRNCGHRENNSTAQGSADEFHRTAQRVSILMAGRHGKTLWAVLHHGPPVHKSYGQSIAHESKARWTSWVRSSTSRGILLRRV